MEKLRAGDVLVERVRELKGSGDRSWIDSEERGNDDVTQSQFSRLEIQ